MFLNHFKSFYLGVGRDRLIAVAAHLCIVAILGTFRSTVPLSGIRKVCCVHAKSPSIKATVCSALRWPLSGLPLKSSSEKEATLMPVDDNALLNHATTGSGRDIVTFSAGSILLRSARLARNSANIQPAPIAARLYTAAPHVT